LTVSQSVHAWSL